MRYKFEQVVRNLDGKIVRLASVSVYLSGTNTPARVYLQKDSAQYVDTPPQLSTDILGRVCFWVDSDDYGYTQRFRLVIQKNNLVTIVDDVKIVEEDYVFVRGIMTSEIADGAVTSSKLATNLQLYGVLYVPVTTVTSNVTLSSTTHCVVLVDATNNNVTVTLPSASGITGRQFVIKRIDSSTRAVTVAAQSGQSVDGVSSLQLTEQGQFVAVVSDGANWRIIGR